MERYVGASRKGKQGKERCNGILVSCGFGHFLWDYFQLQLGEIQSKETLSKASQIKKTTCSNEYLTHLFFRCVQFKEQRLAEEKELLTSQNEWLQSQLRAKSNEMVSMRHEGVSEQLSEYHMVPVYYTVFAISRLRIELTSECS